SDCFGRHHRRRRLLEGSLAPDLGRQERTQHALVRPAQTRARADPGRYAPGAHSAGDGGALLRQSVGLRRHRHGRDGRHPDAGRAHGERPAPRRARQLRHGPRTSRRLHDLVVALRRAAHHRVGGAPHGLAFRRGADLPRAGFSFHRGLARESLLSRVGWWLPTIPALSSRTSTSTGSSRACRPASLATSKSRRSPTGFPRAPPRGTVPSSSSTWRASTRPSSSMPSALPLAWPPPSAWNGSTIWALEWPSSPTCPCPAPSSTSSASSSTWPRPARDAHAPLPARR